MNEVVKKVLKCQWYFPPDEPILSIRLTSGTLFSIRFVKRKRKYPLCLIMDMSLEEARYLRHSLNIPCAIERAAGSNIRIDVKNLEDFIIVKMSKNIEHISESPKTISTSILAAHYGITDELSEWLSEKPVPPS